MLTRACKQKKRSIVQTNFNYQQSYLHEFISFILCHLSISSFYSMPFTASKEAPRGCKTDLSQEERDQRTIFVMQLANRTRPRELGQCHFIVYFYFLKFILFFIFRRLLFCCWYGAGCAYYYG